MSRLTDHWVRPKKKPVVDAALHPVIQSPPEHHIITERVGEEDPDEGGMTAEKAAALIPKEIG
jgi:hypothetical protein